MIDPETNKAISEPELNNDHNISQPIFFDQIVGLFQTVSVAPTLTPRNVKDQIQIYINGATFRLYIWDNTNQLWHYTTLT